MLPTYTEVEREFRGYRPIVLEVSAIVVAIRVHRTEVRGSVIIHAPRKVHAVGNGCSLRSNQQLSNTRQAVSLGGSRSVIAVEGEVPLGCGRGQPREVDVLEFPSYLEGILLVHLRQVFGHLFCVAETVSRQPPVA